MRIGNLDLGNKLILAPMAEVTDFSFRRIAREFGVGLTFTQMVSAQGVIKNNFETLKLLSFSKSEKPIGVQILGNDPGIIGESVKEITRFKPDIIDLNCGCPVDKVVSKKMGSGLLDDPVLIGKLVRKMKDNSNGIPVSIKLRLGRDKRHINIMETVKAAEDNGADVVSIHARTRADKYDAYADWSWVKKAKEKFKVKIVGNGSVFTPREAKELIKNTGCDSVLVARGALGNPFIFSRFNSLIETDVDPGMPEVSVMRDAALRHLDYLLNDLGEEACLDRSKKNFVWYFQYYNGVDFILDRIFGLKNIESIKELVFEHSQNLINHVYEEEDFEVIHQKFKKKVLFWLTESREEIGVEIN